MDINWYPGHMAKTRRMILDSIRQIDAVVELVDARIPSASRNPDIDSLAGNKARLVVLNKSDLADPESNRRWQEYYQARGISALLGNSRAPANRKQALAAIREACREKTARAAARGIVNGHVRVMVLGIPNVGKSTFINNLCGSKRTEVQDRPGVTRTKQWLLLDNGIDLMDTPGILWPKLGNQQDAALLAMTGAIKDSILDLEGLSLLLLRRLAEKYPAALRERYKLSDLPQDPFRLLQQIGRSRGFLLPGGEIDTERTAIILLDEFRGGKIGRITLEEPK